MKVAFQIKNIIDITEPGSDDRNAALDAFQDLFVAALPSGSPIVVYDRQTRSKVTWPGTAMFFADDSVLLVVMDEDGDRIAHALDAETPEGFISLSKMLRETEIGPELEKAAEMILEALGDDFDVVEYFKTDDGGMERI